MSELKVKERTQWGSVLFLWAIGLAAAMQFSKFSISLNQLADHYAIHDSVAALILSSVGVLGIMLGAAAGAFVAAAGTRRSLLLALIVGVVSSMVQWMLPAYQIMLLSRVVEGFSHLLIVVAAPTAMISCSAERHKAITMGLWATFFGVAYALTGLIGITIVENLGLSALYASHGGLMAFLTVIYIVIGERMPKESGQNLFNKLRIAWANQFSVYKSRRQSLPALVFSWHTLMFVALLTFLPSLAGDETTQRLLATVLPLLTIGGSFSGGFIA